MNHFLPTFPQFYPPCWRLEEASWLNQTTSSKSAKEISPRKASRKRNDARNKRKSLAAAQGKMRQRPRPRPLALNAHEDTQTSCRTARRSQTFVCSDFVDFDSFRFFQLLGRAAPSPGRTSLANGTRQPELRQFAVQIIKAKRH